MGIKDDWEEVDMDDLDKLHGADDDDDGGQEDRGDEIGEPETKPEKAGDEGKKADDKGKEGDDNKGDDQGEDELDELLEEEEGGKRGIPKHRFDEVNLRMKAAEDELAELKAKINGGKEGEASGKKAEAEKEKLAFDFAAKEQEYHEALLDGEVDRAKALFAEIQTARNEEILRQAREIARQERENDKKESAAEKEQSAALKLADRIIAAQPYLGKGGNQEAIDEFVDLRDLYLKRGMSRTEAMQKAADRVAKVYGREEAKGEGDDQAAGGGRKAAAVARNADAANRQPPMGKGVGVGSGAAPTSKSVDAMSDEEFDALTPAEKRKLRGD